MSQRYLARRYRYADNVPWNDDRYEIFVEEDGQLLSIGGAIRTWTNRTIAFLCTKQEQRWIHTPQEAEQRASGGIFVWGDSVRDALTALKRQYPMPEKILRDVLERENATF